MNHKEFTPSDMEVIGEVLQSAFLSVYSNLGKDHQLKVDEFFVRHLGQSRPYMLLTPEGVKAMRDGIFGSDVLRHFMLALTSNFFMLWGAGKERKEAFVENVASAFSVDLGIDAGQADGYRAMGDQIRQRCMSFKESKNILMANSWLLVLMILPTYMRFGDFDEIAKKARGGKA